MYIGPSSNDKVTLENKSVGEVQSRVFFFSFFESVSNSLQFFHCLKDFYLQCSQHLKMLKTNTTPDVMGFPT